MHSLRAVLLLLLPLLADCRQEVSEPRSVDRSSIQRAARQTSSIDWRQSAGIFIGIEQFDPGHDRPEPVTFAADDATDLAYFFARERQAEHQLPARRTVLLLAGSPNKSQSQERLRELEHDATVIRADARVCIDAKMIYAQLDRLAREVGPDGILVVAIATHGLTSGQQQLLLTCDSTRSQPRGVVLGRMLQALRERSGRRLLLIVDACRTAQDTPPLGFEDLDVPAGYAVLSAASPRRAAYSRDRLENGSFTYALLEALRCRAPSGADGLLSAQEIDSYVGRRVEQLSGGAQRPEGRFVSALRDAGLVNCSTAAAGEIELPASGMAVDPAGVVKVHVRQPDLFMTVLVCPTVNGVCYNQNPGRVPRPVANGRTTTTSVHYTAPGESEVWVALTPDANFLRDEYEISPVPLDRHAERIVYWLGPVVVNRN